MLQARNWYDRVPTWAYALIAIALLAIAATLEHGMGRVAICKCGVIRLWVGSVKSPENSQQIADWYSFSHVIHGFILYAVFRGVSRRKWPIALCFVLAIFVEATWEVVENSPFVISRYRQTMSQDYAGDSIVNSMSDILFCVIGFWLARWLPVWVTLTLIVVMEVGVALIIRDNLTLNVIMLIHPFQAIKRWQQGVG
jgi:hypothetical protein